MDFVVIPCRITKGNSEPAELEGSPSKHSWVKDHIPSDFVIDLPDSTNKALSWHS